MEVWPIAALTVSFPRLCQGIGTGFNHVEEEKVRSRLLHCKGRMNVVVKEVPISYKSLNSGDSFIFEGEDRIYVWHGHGQHAMWQSAITAHVC